MTSLLRRTSVYFIITVLIAYHAHSQVTDTSTIHFVFTSDAHYGISRKNFQGSIDVDAHTVNAAMIKKINLLPLVAIPNDGGIDAGKKVNSIDYVMQTGDIANRMEPPYQTAAASWNQFETDYLKGLQLKDRFGKPVQFCIVPGNHDASNATGFTRPLQPATDASSITSIYNLMMQPTIAKTKSTYDYEKDKVNYSRNIGGVHFMFVTIWPDSLERIWMEHDLSTVASKTPVIIFAHDPPEGDVKHFTNPNAPYTINATDKFENLVAEKFKGTVTTGESGSSPTIHEERGFVSFLKKHPNIKAYFHGHSNYNEFYEYKGPDNDIALPVFRVDSPMKGKLSSKDETELSFQLIALDTQTGTMTVRECLWNKNASDPSLPIVFGETKTIQLKP